MTAYLFLLGVLIIIAVSAVFWQCLPKSIRRIFRKMMQDMIRSPFMFGQTNTVGGGCGFIANISL